MKIHAAVAAELLQDPQLVSDVLADYRASGLSEAEKTLLRLIEKETLEPRGITRADIDAVRAAGWSDEAIYDAVTVCALFNYYNRWVDATGVLELSDRRNQFSVRNLVKRGYAGSSDS